MKEIILAIYNNNILPINLLAYEPIWPKGGFIMKMKGYFSGYSQAHPIDEQIAILRQYDWGREVDWTLNTAQQEMLTKTSPEGSEGYFAVVFDRTMVTHLEEDSSLDQSSLIKRVMSMLVQAREPYFDQSWLDEDERSPYKYWFHTDACRRGKDSAQKMKRLWQFQGSPTGIMIIPAQLGIKYRFSSIWKARYMILRDSEISLDAYEGIQMLLTHEERFKSPADLWLSFPGSECVSDDDSFNDCWAIDGMGFVHNYDERMEDRLSCSGEGHYLYYGFPSGFFPQ